MWHDLYWGGKHTAGEERERAQPGGESQECSFTAASRGRGPRKQAPPGRRGSGRGGLRAAPGGAAALGFRPDRAGGARSPRPLRRACAVRPPSHLPPPPPRPGRGGLGGASLRSGSAAGGKTRAGWGCGSYDVAAWPVWRPREAEAPFRRPPPGWRSYRGPSRAPGGKEGKATSAVAKDPKMYERPEPFLEKSYFPGFVK